MRELKAAERALKAEKPGKAGETKEIAACDLTRVRANAVAELPNDLIISSGRVPTISVFRTWRKQIKTRAVRTSWPA